MLWLFIFLAAFWLLAYHRASVAVWTLGFALLILFHDRLSSANEVLLWTETLIFAGMAIVFNVPAIRQYLFSSKMLQLYRRMMPHMSRTEREALEAGTVGWEKELFMGTPHWSRLLSMPKGELSEAEQAFLEGPVEEACRQAEDWQITHQLMDLPASLWQYLKDQGFFGLIIPKSYGGKEFSATAHAAILGKLYTRGVTLGTTVGVPNSLGPAELILHYGTEEQKNYYLPRLAKGEEIPCFALTNPEAGSDASNIPDYGIVCRGIWEGKEVLGMRLTWNKRYITLAPVATLLGLAFKLYDPDHLLGDQNEWGITCALIPVKTSGVKIGRRHFPLDTAFQNGPTQGQDVFVPLDWIIGGAKMAGHGWRMLVECLSAGRAISLPSTGMGGSKGTAFAVGAYARIRKQFGLSIGKFEGIQEPLARMSGFAHIINAGIQFTCARIDRGEKPAVASAILKYHMTELARKVANDGMDILGGKGICLGPKNFLGRNYESTPIAITVEGANILTRNLIIFGQGALRCHPYLLAELNAAEEKNPEKSLRWFDRAFSGHVGYVVSNWVRALSQSLTAGWLVKTPKSFYRRYYQQFTRMSTAFALTAEMATLVLGANLKRKERLSARLGDVLSALYLGSAVLKYDSDQGSPEAMRPIMKWMCGYLLRQAQDALQNILRHFPHVYLGKTLEFLLFPYGRPFSGPSDRLDQLVAESLMVPNLIRDNLEKDIYHKVEPGNIYIQLKQALSAVIEVEFLEKQLQSFVREGKVRGYSWKEQIDAALRAGLFTSEEGERLHLADKLRQEIIAVDDFPPGEWIRD